MKTPLVSIYVVTYNQENYLRDCLDGIVMQKTDFAFEAIVIDDASSDSNPEIIMEYAEKYPDIIRPVLLKENYWSQGRSKFFEIFFPIAKGKYVAFCEGDDYWIYEGKLQQQVDFLESHPDYSMCFHNYKYVNGATETRQYDYYYTRLIKNHTLEKYDIILHNITQTATVVTRRNLFDKDTTIEEDCKKFKHSDMRFFAAYAFHGKIYGFAHDWSVYRQVPSSVTIKEMSLDKLKKINEDQMNLIFNLYNGAFRNCEKLYRIMKLMGKSSQLMKERKIISALTLKTKAFFTNPIFVIRLYKIRYSGL